jgi:hypothetical protein
MTLIFTTLLKAEQETRLEEDSTKYCKLPYRSSIGVAASLYGFYPLISTAESCNFSSSMQSIILFRFWCTECNRFYIPIKSNPPFIILKEQPIQ